MSQCNWPEVGFGMMLFDKNSNGVDEVAMLVGGYNRVHPDDGVKDAYDFTEIGAFDGKARYYDDQFDGRDFYACFSDACHEWDTGLFFWAEHQPKPFAAAYDDVDECVAEFKGLLGEYLPEDFDWKAHIGTFSASIYC